MNDPNSHSKGLANWLFTNGRARLEAGMCTQPALATPL